VEISDFRDTACSVCVLCFLLQSSHCLIHTTQSRVAPALLQTLSFPIVFGLTEYTGRREQSRHIFSSSFPDIDFPYLMFVVET